MTVNCSEDLTRRGLLRQLTGLGALGALGGLSACGSTATQDRSQLLEAALALPVLADDSRDPASGVFFGIFRESPLTDVVSDATADLRRKPAAAMWFTRFGSVFPESQIRFLAAEGLAAQVTWEPWGSHDEAIPLDDINAGRWDSYLDTWGAAAATLDMPFMLRFGHEFNGDWYPWSLARNGRDAGAAKAYASAFRRVVTRLRAAGARRVQHVWCYNHNSQPPESWNDPRAAYPGDDFVDWIGIDGYNFGTSQSWSRWTAFRDVFANAVALASEISPRKPIVLAEMGCSETGGDKAEWIARMAADFARMPSVRAFTWFDIVKETSWALTSSEASWLAAIHALRQPHIRGNGAALLAVAAARP
jgi:hypothetical protein